ncbi:MAG TPA: PAS domain-containing protein [Deinococcales bacterium]|nr:PAS domain-containing protein [Deinococcales bacterium]
MSQPDPLPASLPAQLFSLAVQSAATGVFLLDEDMRLTYANPAFLRETGYEHDEVVGRAAADFLAPAQEGGRSQDLRERLRLGEQARQVLLARRKDGSTFWVNLSLSPLREDDGRLTGFVGVGEDLNSLRDAQAQVERAASTDGLTGLPNRRAFDSALAIEYARAVRHSYRLSVLFFDLVNFSAVNDLAGNEVGERGLRQVAAALSAGGKGGGQAFRVGVDEFALILPHASGAQAGLVAERAARAVSEIDLGGYRLKVKVGSAVFPEDSRDASGLVAVATGRVRHEAVSS